MKTAHLLIAGLALIGLSNAVALGGVWLNRSGEPDSRLPLSERELRRSYDWAEREGSGLALRLDWQRRSNPNGDGRYDSLWLDEPRLLELGFSRDDRRSREVLVVLELDGPARADELKRARQRLDKAREDLRASPADSRRQEAERDLGEQLEQLEHRESRLFAVDLGQDREALRNRYPDRSRYAILPAAVNTWISDGRLKGQVGQLRISEINVPHAWRESLGKALASERNGEPPTPFKLWLSLGRRLEPWLDSPPDFSGGEGQGRGGGADSLASSNHS